MTATVGTAAHTPRRSPGETVAIIDEASMLRGFVEAFAAACAKGVPVRLRGSVRTFQMDGRTHTIDEAVLARERLQRELSSARQSLANAVTSVEKAKDEMVLALMVQRAEAHAAHIRQIEQQLDDLQSSPAPTQPPVFETATDVLLAALANIVSSRRLSLEEHAAFRTVVPSLRMARCEDGDWVVEAVVQLPVADGLAELGPIRWHAAVRGLGTAATRAVRKTPAPNGTRFSRHSLRRSLEVDARLAPDAASLLTATPFAELPHLMLYVRAGYDLPEWISDDWARPEFLEHLQAVYGAEPGRWAGPRQYGRRMPRAQAVVDLAADVGRLTLAGYREVLPGVDANEMWVFARWHEVAGRKRGPVVDQHVEPDGTWSLGNRLCQCGRPALVVARAPEIPGSLLCECGLAVDAEPGSTAEGLVFPAAYQALRVPRAQWMRDLRRTSGQLRDPLSEVSGRQAQILEVFLQDPGRPRLCSELAAVTGIGGQTCQWNLNQLRRRDFLLSEGRPAQFWLVDAEQTRVVIARSGNELSPEP